MRRTLSPKEVAALVEAASRARTNAYAPYSQFKVGAAVVCDDGRVYTGCNVENASYGLSLCAERAAVAAAVLHGSKQVLALALVAAASPAARPCGACLQWLAEFGAGDMQVLMADAAGEVEKATLVNLLPQAFRLPNP